MTDEELIELAAKAAGINLKERQPVLALDGKSYLPPVLGRWNPLKTPGDALELAMNLHIKIIPGKYKGDGCSAESVFWKAPGVTVFNDEGMNAQAMRAVTMVAANIQIAKENRTC